MTMQPLRAADSNPFGVCSERDADGPALGWVIEHGRRAVRVDIVDRFRREARTGGRVAHGPCSVDTVWMRHRHVVGVTGSRVAGELGVNVRSARIGVLE